jgi:DNA-binding MarR family transcriptional regulator
MVGSGDPRLVAEHLRIDRFVQAPRDEIGPRHGRVEFVGNEVDQVNLVSCPLKTANGGRGDREGLGISMAQFMVLSVIDAHPGDFNQQSIADLLGLTKGTVSRQIDNASAAGLLVAKVSVTSRREKTIALTEQGTALVRRGDELPASSNSGIFPHLDRGDLAATLRTLAAFVAATDAQARPPSSH